jgi:urease accessory protein
MRNLQRFGLLAAAMTAAAPAFAHTGVGPAAGFGRGFMHPLGGIDHLAAMIAVGLWAAQQGKRALWSVPLAFVAMMALGGAIGMAGVSLPFVEQGIAASALVLGVLIAAAARLPLAAGVLLVAAFAVFHGHAHGAEMPATASGLAYGAGFIAATALLHAVGAALGVVLRKLGRPRVLRLAGAAVVFCGCASTRDLWYKETGRMDAAEASAHGYPDCAGLTLAACGKKHPAPSPDAPK